MSNNYCYIASAGAGKTTFIVKDSYKRALLTTKKIGIVTFTSNNQNTEKQKYIDIHKKIPTNVKIIGWYSFLLDYFIRPFKGDVIERLYDIHVSQAFINPPIIKQNGHKLPHYQKGDLKSKYLTTDNNIYKDYLSEFALECLQKNSNTLLNRLQQIFDTIYFDESQDFGGFDLDIIKSILKNTSIDCIITTDPRQHTYSSCNLIKHKKYNGRIDLFCSERINQKRKTFIIIDNTKFIYSHRCNADICRFASQIHSEFPETTPCKCDQCIEKKSHYTKEQGVYLVNESNTQLFINQYNATILTYNKDVKTNAIGQRFNFGECKGDEFNGVLIYPTKDILTWLKKNNTLSPTTKSKFYVALTRAIFIVGIVVPNNFIHSRFNLQYWSPSL